MSFWGIGSLTDSVGQRRKQSFCSISSNIEGLSYGKLEAGLLTFIIPIVLLGHLSGLMDDGVKLSLLGSWMALLVLFAGRKFTQSIKDDIGDKSVFIFQSLPEDEKKALVKKLEQQEYSQNPN